MRLSLLFIALPVLGLPGPKHGRSSTPASWFSPSISPQNSPVRSGSIGWSITPQYPLTPNLSPSVLISSPPRSSSQPIPFQSRSLPTSPIVIGSTKSNSGLPVTPSKTPKIPFTEEISPFLSLRPSSFPSPSLPKKWSGVNLSSTPFLSPHDSWGLTTSDQLHSSIGTVTGSNQLTTSSSRSSTTQAADSTATGNLSLSASSDSTSHESQSQIATSDNSGSSTASSSRSSTRAAQSQPTRSLSFGVASGWTTTNSFNSPGASPANPNATKTRQYFPGATSEWISTGTKTIDDLVVSATGSYAVSEYTESDAPEYSETETTVSMITPDPSSVEISETETVEGVEDNTIYKTKKDGRETSIPILFGARCLIFCNTGAMLLWGIGPEDGKFVLPPIPGISPLPSFIEIKGGIPTPEGTQGSDSEPTESLNSQTEESSVTSTLESSSTSETSATSGSTTLKSTTTESTTAESTSTCTRATITNCAITTSCGPETCSTQTTCEPTVSDCTAIGTTVSTTTSDNYELTMVVYIGHTLVTPLSSSASTSTTVHPSYELTMAVYTGHSLVTPLTSSISASSTPSYELTMVEYTGHSLATPLRSTPRSNTPLYELTMVEHTGHSLVTPLQSSTPTSSTPLYEFTMAVYTGHSLASPWRPSAPASPSPSYNHTTPVFTSRSSGKSSTFRTYKITSTKVVGGETPLCAPFAYPGGQFKGACLCSYDDRWETLPFLDTTSNLCGYTSIPTQKTTKTTSSSSKVSDLAPPIGNASCYPKLGKDEHLKVLEIPDARLNQFCGDPTHVLKKLRDPPRIDYVEAGWVLDDNSPEACNELPTMEGDSDAYWVCTVALDRIARDCPWNGGKISSQCGEFRLRGCIGPCDDETI